jgi:hypothetical protein
MTKASQKLHDLGQSLWLDNITRDLLKSAINRVVKNYSSGRMECLRNRERARIYHHRPKIFHQSPPMPSQITILIILAIAPMVHQVRVST